MGYKFNPLIFSGLDLTGGATLPIDLETQVTGILPVANGGTGTDEAPANQVFAGPTSGADAPPSFRSLTSADLPWPLYSQINGAANAPAINIGTMGDNDTGIYTQNDGNISFSANGFHRLSIDQNDSTFTGDLHVTGNIDAANFPSTGPANYFAAYNNTGDLSYIPGWTWNDLTDGMAVNNTWDIAPTGDSFNLHNMEFAVEASAPATDPSHLVMFRLDMHHDRNNTGNDFLGSLEGFSVNANTEGSGNVEFLRTASLYQFIGNGTDSNNVDQAYLIDTSVDIRTNASVLNGRGWFLNVNNQGTVTNDYALMDIGISGNAITNNMNGLRINMQASTSSGDQRLLSLNSGGNTANNYSFIDGNNTGDVSNSLTYIGLNNNGDVAGDFQGMNLTNNGDALRGTFINLYNQGTFTENCGALNFNDNGDSGGWLGININKQGNTTDVSRNMEGINVFLNGNSAANKRGIGIFLGSGTTTGAVGLNIDASQVVLPSGVPGNAIDSNGFHSFNNNITAPAGFSGFIQSNYMGGNLHVASGVPLSNTYGFMDNLATAYAFEDDIGPDPLLGFLGISSVGYVGQIIGASGKTFDTLAFASSGASVGPGSTGGTVSNVYLYNALGVLPGADPLTITNLTAFNVSPVADILAANNWGLRVQAANAENYIAKSLVIGGMTQTVTNSDVAFEISSTKALRLGQLTETQRNALVPLAGMTVYNTDTNTLQYYNGTSWADSSAQSPGDIAETNFSGANNQATPDDVVGFLFASSVKSFEALVNVQVDATTPLYEHFKLIGINKGGTWSLYSQAFGDDSDVDFFITGGQVQYTSANYTGFVSLDIDFRALTLNT